MEAGVTRASGATDKAAVPKKPKKLTAVQKAQQVAEAEERMMSTLIRKAGNVVLSLSHTLRFTRSGTEKRAKSKCTWPFC